MTSVGIQVHGGMGFIEETGATQYLRDVRITSIYEGTTGIQAIDLVGRKVARDSGSAMFGFIDLMRAELERLKYADEAAVEIRARAIRAVGLLRDATDCVLKLTRGGPAHAQAIAVPYLMLCGSVMGAWAMVKALVIATERLAEDAPFYQNKCEVCRFYVHHILPQAYSFELIVRNGFASVDDADSDLL
jgi:hypothetical protein